MKIYQAILFFLWFAFIIAIPPYWLKNNGHADLITPDFWLIFTFLVGLNPVGDHFHFSGTANVPQYVLRGLYGRNSG